MYLDDNVVRVRLNPVIEQDVQNTKYTLFSASVCMRATDKGVQRLLRRALLLTGGFEAFTIAGVQQPMCSGLLRTSFYAH